MGVIDFSQYVSELIQGGQTIEGNVVRIIADNGDEIGEAVFKVIQGGNGTASDVGVAVKTAGGVATTTGTAFLALDVGVVGAAIAPALGVLAGIGLYKISDATWNWIRDELYSRGQTVNGAVIGYWNGENVYLSEETIEIFKQGLVNQGLFNTGVTIDDTTGLDMTNVPVPIILNDPTQYSGPQHKTNPVRLYKTSDANVQSCLLVKYTENMITVLVMFASSSPFTLTEEFFINGVPQGNPTTSSAVQITINNKTVYWAYSSAAGDPDYIYPVGTVNVVNDMPASDTVEYILSYGEDGYINGDSLQDPDETIFPNGNPFPLSYLSWLPWEYPITDPSGLPEIYPIKYPGLPPDPYPEQEPAQDPEPESPAEIIPIIEPGFEIPDPAPFPEPPEPDPDPQPEPEPIEPDPPPVIDPDPPEPNPDPTPTPIIPPAPLPSTVSSNKLFTVYNPTSSQLDSLGGYLWDASLIATLRDIWQDPLDGIISLIQVYATPNISGSHDIILGYLDTGISCAVVGNQFVTVDCGSVQIKENKGNATDYAPYTSIHLYLPFIGIVELDANECMNSTMSIKYRVDMYTGTCLALVSITRSEDMPNSPILYTFNGNCAQQLPLTSGNATGVLTALIGAIGTALTAGSGGGLTMAAGVSIAGQSLSHEMMHVNHSGNISANAGIMGNKKPYVIIGRRHGYDATNYNKYYGFPANKTVTLGNHSGYVKIKKCWLKTSATQVEYKNIMELLEDGVFL